MTPEQVKYHLTQIETAMREVQDDIAYENNHIIAEFLEAANSHLSQAYDAIESIRNV